MVERNLNTYTIRTMHTTLHIKDTEIAKSYMQENNTKRRLTLEMTYLKTHPQSINKKQDTFRDTFKKKYCIWNKKNSL